MSQSLNFANQDLRDRSFKGKDLAGADFSGADIRGCNFYRSQLKAANFANVRAGKSQRQTIFASIISLVMALMFAGTMTISAILLITFAIAFLLGIESIDRQKVYWVAIAAIIIFAIGFTLAFTGSFLAGKKRGIFGASLISLLVAFLAGFWGSTFTKILVAGAFKAIASALIANSFLALSIFLVIEPLQILGSLYLFRLAIQAPSMTVGTKFQYADLTKASFYSATLVNCDFSKAIVEDVDWGEAQILRCKL
jgi:hypothetical protein